MAKETTGTIAEDPFADVRGLRNMFARAVVEEVESKSSYQSENPDTSQNPNTLDHVLGHIEHILTEVKEHPLEAHDIYKRTMIILKGTGEGTALPEPQKMDSSLKKVFLDSTYVEVDEAGPAIIRMLEDKYDSVLSETSSDGLTAKPSTEVTIDPDSVSKATEILKKLEIDDGNGELALGLAKGALALSFELQGKNDMAPDSNVISGPLLGAGTE